MTFDVSNWQKYGTLREFIISSFRYFLNANASLVLDDCGHTGEIKTENGQTLLRYGVDQTKKDVDEVIEDLGNGALTHHGRKTPKSFSLGRRGGISVSLYTHFSGMRRNYYCTVKKWVAKSGQYPSSTPTKAPSRMSSPRFVIANGRLRLRLARQ